MFNIAQKAIDYNNPPLSMVHISPQGEISKPKIELWLGAGLVKVSSGLKVNNNGGLVGKRGLATFSKASRRRLMYKLSKISRDQLPVFVTLTYPNEFPDDIKVVKKHLDTFFKRMFRQFPWAGVVWKLEYQKRMAAHFHCLVYGVNIRDLRAFVPYAWHDIAGGGDELHLKWHLGLLGNGNTHCVTPVKTYNGVKRYASKYMGKEVESVPGSGRWWGVRNPANVPFVNPVVAELEYREVWQLFRYLRRYMRLKSKYLLVSLSVMCDPDQWFDNLHGLLNTGCYGEGPGSPRPKKLKILYTSGNQ